MDHDASSSLSPLPPHVGRIVVAMSGGVDSSVAAALLHAQGLDVVGVTLHLWDASGASKVGRCCAPEDRDDARRVCDHLGIPHYVVDERALFRERVVDPFVAAYAEGTTPAPCVACNQHVKLTRLVALADAFGATHVATGHYARIEYDSSARPRLLRGRDAEKDQSYFLYGAPTSVLARLMFPLGALTKDQTRAEGRRLGVPNANKPDSQELCFVPDGDVGSFVETQGGSPRTGRIIDESGAEIGRHAGVHRFTVGQRRGLGLAGGAPARYVLRIVRDTGDVVVGADDALGARTFRARDVAWTVEAPTSPFEGLVRVRHRHLPAAARITPVEGGFEASFDVPQRALTPGQAAVIYRGEEVVGGGTIV
jgi:tRNA-specific 2-thiouridylase